MASAIQALPTDTVRLLGAATVIASPHAVVKELLDNAIDAGATLVEIGITQDTLSRISLRDNGSGISQGDFDHLGRRSHTSKLRCFEDLRSKGGSTLGFRGEALASMATTGKLSITTRTRDTLIASILDIKPNGGVGARSTGHAPVGTTVVLSNLFDSLPVRKRASKKAAENTLRSIKKLLQSYILARPQLKIVFKLLDTPKGAWTYNPGTSPNTREAVLQLFGHSLASTCVSRLYGHHHPSESDIGPQNDECPQPQKLRLEALWPEACTPADRISKYGSFVSVDSRPISTSRGVGCKIYEAFRKACCSAYGPTEKAPTSPFMQLNIICPAESYDPNVDPLKEMLIFGDENQLVYCVKELCQDLFPPHVGVIPESQDFSRPSTAWSHYVRSESGRLGADHSVLTLGLSARNPDDVSSTMPSALGLQPHLFNDHVMAEEPPVSCPLDQALDQATPRVQDLVPPCHSPSSSPPDSVFDLVEQDERDFQFIAQEVEHMADEGASGTTQKKVGTTLDALRGDPLPITLSVRTKFTLDMARTRTLSDQEDHGMQDVRVMLSSQDLEALLSEGKEETARVSAPTQSLAHPLGLPTTVSPKKFALTTKATSGSGDAISLPRMDLRPPGHGAGSPKLDVTQLRNKPQSQGLLVAQCEPRAPPRPPAQVGAVASFVLGGRQPRSLDNITQRCSRPSRRDGPKRDGPTQTSKRSLCGNLDSGKHKQLRGGQANSGSSQSERRPVRSHGAVQSTIKFPQAAPMCPSIPACAPTVSHGLTLNKPGLVSGCLNLSQTVIVNLGTLTQAIRCSCDLYARAGKIRWGINEEEKSSVFHYVYDKMVELRPDLEFFLFAAGSK